MAFDAFISYSHAADGRLAPALQNGLQRLGKSVFARRALRVFRDETGLSTNPHLWGSIEEALDGSEWFVLLASPDAAASEWVGREVESWLARDRLERLLLVVTDGDLEFQEDGRIDRERTTCLPPPLLAALTAEPRWLDLRWARDETQLDLRNGRFRAAVADLAAPIHGVAKEDLEGEDVRQQRRARRLAIAGVSVVGALAIAAGIAAVVAVGQQHRARAATKRAVARSLAAESRSLSDTDIDLSLLLAVEGIRRDDSFETRSSLLSALDAGRRIDRFAHGLPSDISDLALAPDRSTLWLVRANGLIQSYDPKTLTRKAIQPFAESASPWALTLSRDGRRLAYSNARGVRVVDAKTRKELARFPFPNTSLEFDRTGDRLLVVSVSPPRVTLVDVPTGRTLGRLGLAAHTFAQWPSATFLENGGVVATTDGLFLRRYDSALRPRGPQSPKQTIAAQALHGSPDGKRIALVGGKDVALLDAKTLEPVGPPVATRGSRVIHVSFTPDGSRLAISGDDGSVIVISTADASEVADFAGLTGNTESQILDSSRVLSVSITNSQAVVWKLGVAPGPGVARPGGGQIGTLSTEDGPGTEIWTASGKVFRRVRGKVLSASLGKGMRDGSGLSIDRNGHRAAVAAGPTGHSLFGGTVVSIMNLDTMRVVRTIAMPPRFGEAISLAFSPNGKRLAVGSTLGYFSVVDPATGRPVLRPTPISSIRWVLTSLVWTPDGRRVFVGGQAGVLYGFDARTWKLRSKTPLTAEASLTGSAVSPDGSCLVVPSESGQVFKIDPVTGAEQGTPFAVRGTQLQAAAVSGDGSVVAALGRDGRLQLWDSRTQRPLGPALSSHAGFASALAPTGTEGFVTGGIEDPGIVEWNLTPSSWTAAACRRVQRNLTAAEWTTYVGSGSRHRTCTAFP